jgi:hypothetical protein
MYDTQPPYNASGVSQSGKASRRFYSKKGSAKVPCSTYSIAQVSYELNVSAVSALAQVSHDRH